MDMEEERRAFKHPAAMTGRSNIEHPGQIKPSLLPYEEEDGKTESDLCYIDKLEPPSFIKGITMEKWLQMKD